MTKNIYGARHPLSETIDALSGWLLGHSFKKIEIDAKRLTGISDEISKICTITGINERNLSKLNFGVSIERNFLFTWERLSEEASEKKVFSIAPYLSQNEDYSPCEFYQLDVVLLDDLANFPVAKGLVLELCGILGIQEDSINLKPAKLGFLGPAVAAEFKHNGRTVSSSLSENRNFGIAGVVRPELWESIGRDPDSLGVCVSLNLNAATKKTRLS